MRISEHYISPTIPDYMSTYGIPQIVGRVAGFSEAIGENIEPLGIVATKFQANSTVNGNVIKQLKSDKNIPAVMKTVIRQGNGVAAAAEFQAKSRQIKRERSEERGGGKEWGRKGRSRGGA